jgi:hypothetical protein
MHNDGNLLTANPLPAHEARDDGRGGLAMISGAGAALVGGLIWAGIVLLTDYEIGWVAWGIGALVGTVVARVTSRRAPSLGLTAAGMAAGGLLIGKFAISMGSVGAVAEELYHDDDYLRGALAWQMYAEAGLPEELTGGVAATLAAGDTLSDALWSAMLEPAGARLTSMTDAERRDLASTAAADIVGGMSISEAIRVQLGPADLLWFGLALATAYGMVASRKPEPAV